jgi:hypothetical protein
MNILAIFKVIRALREIETAYSLDLVNCNRLAIPTLLRSFSLIREVPTFPFPTSTPKEMSSFHAVSRARLSLLDSEFCELEFGNGSAVPRLQRLVLMPHLRSHFALGYLPLFLLRLGSTTYVDGLLNSLCLMHAISIRSFFLCASDIYFRSRAMSSDPPSSQLLSEIRSLPIASYG